MVISKPNKGVKKVFFAGPIQGAPAWHEKLMEELKDENIIIASPKRNKEEGFDYDSQVNWETENLTNSDIIIFYLCNKESNIPGRSYAQTSRFELGENLARIAHTNSKQKVLVYGEEGFSGLSYIKLKVDSDKYSHFASYFDNRDEFLSKLRELINE